MRAACSAVRSKCSMKTTRARIQVPFLAISKLSSAGNLTALIATVRQHADPGDLADCHARAAADPRRRHRRRPDAREQPVDIPCASNDGYSAKVIADYGLNTLKLKKWAIITFDRRVRQRRQEQPHRFAEGSRHHAGAGAGLYQQLAGLHADCPCRQELGRPISSRPTLPTRPSRRDLRQAVAAGWASRPRGSARRRYRPLPRLMLAGDALYGSYSIADFSPDSSPEAQAYATKYRAAYKVEPDFYSAWAYDSVKLLALAIKNANSTKPDDVAKALRAIKGYKGVEGTYTFDANGDELARLQHRQERRRQDRVRQTHRLREISEASSRCRTGEGRLIFPSPVWTV